MPFTCSWWHCFAFQKFTHAVMMMLFIFPYQLENFSMLFILLPLKSWRLLGTRPVLKLGNRENNFGFFCTYKDDCCLLPSEVQVPSYSSSSPAKFHGLASATMVSRNAPMQVRRGLIFVVKMSWEFTMRGSWLCDILMVFQLEFGANPLKWYNGADENSGIWMDGLRLLWLGKSPAGVKVCNRCVMVCFI